MRIENCPVRPWDSYDLEILVLANYNFLQQPLMSNMIQPQVVVALLSSALWLRHNKASTTLMGKLYLLLVAHSRRTQLWSLVRVTARGREAKLTYVLRRQCKNANSPRTKHYCHNSVTSFYLVNTWKKLYHWENSLFEHGNVQQWSGQILLSHFHMLILHNSLLFEIALSLSQNRLTSSMSHLLLDLQWSYKTKQKLVGLYSQFLKWKGA